MPISHPIFSEEKDIPSEWQQATLFFLGSLIIHSLPWSIQEALIASNMNIPRFFNIPSAPWPWNDLWSHKSNLQHPLLFWKPAFQMHSTALHVQQAYCPVCTLSTTINWNIHDFLLMELSCDFLKIRKDQRTMVPEVWT